ncbi:MAG: polysaccharide biosynthesis protein [Pseudomonadota bacterium]
MKQFLKGLTQLPRWQKMAVLLGFDGLALLLAAMLAYVLRLDKISLVLLQEDTLLLAAAGAATSLGAFYYLGLYRVVVRFAGQRLLKVVISGSLAGGLVMALVSYFGQLYMPRSIPFLYTLVAVVLVVGGRLLARGLLLGAYSSQGRTPVVIYGAGASGQQLLAALRQTGGYSVVGFVDDDPELWNREVAGVRVYPPTAKRFEKLRDFGVEEVLLAMPSARRSERRQVLGRLEPYPFYVRTVPGVEAFLNGDFSADQLQEVSLEDLLGRDPVPAEPELLAQCIRGKTVLVTGAGGSIGSELCRQALQQGAKTLLLLDASEFALYQVERELGALVGEGQQLVALLGSVSDQRRVGRVFDAYTIDTVYHAAAYKHVPLVEANPGQGIANNTFGTQVVAEAADSHGVKHFVLISTDKAVRPTNVMGASKRLAELVLQGLHARGSDTVFTMVRFGNVLGSSGSVVPLFRQQIADGGPVTVTHPEITRFFMTIPEAVELVIQAGAMSGGGEVFVLDMGEPVRIVDLARRMIQLSGLEVRDQNHPEGDVEIVFTGLRPGEKLYEELLIGEKVSPTRHSKILQAREEWLPWSRLMESLERIDAALVREDYAQTRALLLEVVNGYRPGEALGDALWKTGEFRGDNVTKIQ